MRPFLLLYLREKYVQGTVLIKDYKRIVEKFNISKSSWLKSLKFQVIKTHYQINKGLFDSNFEFNVQNRF